MPDRLAGRRLFVGTPMYDGRCDAAFAFSMVRLSALCAQRGIALRCFFANGEALISKARNATADQFLQSGDDHLLFIDSDIGFDAQDALALLALQVDHANADVVAAPYPLKRLAWDRVRQAAKAGFADADPERLARVSSAIAVHPLRDGEFPIAQPLEVMHTGTGFMMIRRETFLRLHEILPRPTYRATRIGLEREASEQIIAFFETEIGDPDAGGAIDAAAFVARNPHASGRDVADFLAREASSADQGEDYYSEDYAFCRAVRRAGMRIWLCPWMALTHHGSHRFTSRLADFAELEGG